MIEKLKRGVSSVRARNSTLPSTWPWPGGTTIGDSGTAGSYVAPETSMPVWRARVAAHRERRLVRIAVPLEHPAAVALARSRALAARVAFDRDERPAHQPLDQADVPGHSLLGVEHEVARSRGRASVVPAPALD